MAPAVGWSGLVTRRAVVGGLTAAALAGATRPLPGGTRVWRQDDPRSLSAFERAHFPRVRLPAVTANGAKVPLAIEMTHPMEPGHSITALEAVNAADPVPSKGTFEPSPANGQVYLAFQVRMHDGAADVAVTATCSRHGRWTTVQGIRVLDGAGGCAAPAAPGGGRAPDDGPAILPPRLRVPRLVRGGRIDPGEVIEVQLSMRHPNRTGLAWRDGRFVQETEPFHLSELLVLYGPVEASRFRMTSALSDDPLITFRLRAGRGGPLRAVLTNTRGQRFEALTEVPVS